MDERSDERLPYGPMPSESAEDWFDRRCAQLESLTTVLSGEVGDGFRMFNNEIQGNVMWLIRDLTTEVKDAHAAAMKEREQWAAKNPDRVRERGHPGH